MRRWSGIAGIAFVVLAIVSRAVRGSLPDFTKRDALTKLTTYYADKSHNDHAVVAVALGFIGLFAFAWFIGGLWSELRRAEGAATMPTIIVAVGGAAFVALGMVFHIFSEGLGVTLHFAKGYTVDKGFDAGTALLMSSLAQGAFLASMLAVGAATAAAGVVMLRTRALPVWLAWLGVAIAVLCLPTIPPLTLIAAVLLAIWTLVTSGWMIRAGAPPGSPAATS
jgi:hypothetical protein